jgi:hypothetical protein
MSVAGAKILKKSFEHPDEVREFQGKGHSDIVNLGDGAVGRGVYEPGWRWSENVKPIAGTDSCQSFHHAYCVSGHMTIAMTDGSGEITIGPGDATVIPPGHDAWVVGDEPVVLVDWTGMKDYAKR